MHLRAHVSAHDAVVRTTCIAGKQTRRVSHTSYKIVLSDALAAMGESALTSDVAAVMMPVYHNHSRCAYFDGPRFSRAPDPAVVPEDRKYVTRVTRVSHVTRRGHTHVTHTHTSMPPVSPAPPTRQSRQKTASTSHPSPGSCHIHSSATCWVLKPPPTPPTHTNPTAPFSLLPPLRPCGDARIPQPSVWGYEGDHHPPAAAAPCTAAAGGRACSTLLDDDVE